VAIRILDYGSRNPADNGKQCCCVTQSKNNRLGIKFLSFFVVGHDSGPLACSARLYARAMGLYLPEAHVIVS